MHINLSDIDQPDILSNLDILFGVVSYIDQVNIPSNLDIFFVFN